MIMDKENEFEKYTVFLANYKKKKKYGVQHFKIEHVRKCLKIQSNLLYSFSFTAISS